MLLRHHFKLRDAAEGAFIEFKRRQQTSSKAIALVSVQVKSLGEIPVSFVLFVPRLYRVSFVVTLAALR